MRAWRVPAGMLYTGAIPGAAGSRSGTGRVSYGTLTNTRVSPLASMVPKRTWLRIATPALAASRSSEVPMNRAVRNTSSRRFVCSTPRKVVTVNDMADVMMIRPTTMAIMISTRVMPRRLHAGAIMVRLPRPCRHR